MIELTRASFGRESVEEYYIWKYFENPEGDVIAYTAKNENGILAGFYGLIPEAYHFNGIKHILYQSCDTMTHPDFRRMGIFETLAKLTYDELILQNKLLVKGFAGEMSYPGFITKLKWQGLERIKPFFKIAAQFQLSSLSNKLLSFGNSIRFEDSDQIIQEMNDLDITISKQFPISKSRDKKYLDWRFKDPLSNNRIIYCYLNEKLIGYCIYVIESNSLLLIRDVFALENKYYKKILGFVDLLAAENKLKGIYCWTNKNSFYDKLFKRNLFLKNPFNSGIMTSPLYFIILDNDSVQPSSLTNNISNWNLLPIDYDF